MSDYTKHIAMLKKQRASSVTITEIGGGLTTDKDGRDITARTIVTSVRGDYIHREIFQGHCKGVRK